MFAASFMRQDREDSVEMAEPVLFERSYPVNGGDFDKSGEVSTQIKSFLSELDMNSTIIRRAAIATFEAEVNVVIHAESSGIVEMVLTPVDIIIRVTDDGQGIADIELAMQEGFSTASDQMREMGFGAGMGLPNIKRNADRFTIESQVGRGTTLEIVIHHQQR